MRVGIRCAYRRSMSAAINVRVEQPVQVDDKISHMGIVHGLLCLALPSCICRGVVRVDADDVETFQVPELMAAELSEFAAEYQMRQLWTDGLVRHRKNPPLTSTLSGCLSVLDTPGTRALDQSCVAIPPGSDEGAVDRLGTVISQHLPGKRCQRATGFVHQKVRCCKVPVMAVGAREGNVEFSVRDARETKRQRANSRHRNDLHVCLGEAREKLLGPRHL